MTESVADGAHVIALLCGTEGAIEHEERRPQKALVTFADPGLFPVKKIVTNKPNGFQQHLCVC